MEHFGAVFKLELTEETRVQLQEEEAIIVSSCLILATPAYGHCKITQGEADRRIPRIEIWGKYEQQELGRRWRTLRKQNLMKTGGLSPR